MALREIITLPHPTLRRKAHKVTDFGPELQTLVDDMVETMRQAPGVGLAAPQVNVSLRIIVVEYGSDEDEEAPKKLYTVINPEITRPSPETVLGTEGCLSVPGIVGEVERIRSVDGQRLKPARPADHHQGQRLAGAHLPARDRSPGWDHFRRPRYPYMEWAGRPGFHLNASHTFFPDQFPQLYPAGCGRTCRAVVAGGG